MSFALFFIYIGLTHPAPGIPAYFSVDNLCRTWYYIFNFTQGILVKLRELGRAVRDFWRVGKTGFALFLMSLQRLEYQPIQNARRIATPCQRVSAADLASRPVDWPDLSREAPEQLDYQQETFNLREHQKTAFDDVLNGFKASDRGKRTGWASSIHPLRSWISFYTVLTRSYKTSLQEISLTL